MTNQVEFRTDDTIDAPGIKVSIFNDEGKPVLNGWQEFLVNRKLPGGNGPWDPAKYGAPVTSFYIGKGVLQGADHKDNNFVAGAIRVDFNKESDGVVIIGIKKVQSKSGGNGCWEFKATGQGVNIEVLPNGTKKIPGTELPKRCQG